MDGMLLVIDVGNTQIVLGVYDGKSLKAHWRLDTKARRTEDEMAVMVSQLFNLAGIEARSVKNAIISCVVPPLLPALLNFCRNTFSCDPLVVGPGIKSGVSIRTDDPREVGADRIANTAGGLSIFDPPMILIDFGTAITIDAISKNAEYLGGAIIPGIELSMNALYHKAAKLPKVEITKPPSIIGANTVHSMQSGAFYGYVCLVDGIVKKMKSVLGAGAKVIATGGEAALVAKSSETIEHVEDNLTLIGLRVIHEKNER
ncbi:Pantothenate kinase type III, CoaX-like [hydrothermal vent metagenome]|uniref:Type III pantothenate kinase n=1 Tax=hydrothermal vent metagenome TaxID=652676 RepID=A0A3B1CYU4_9ZZZZ